MEKAKEKRGKRISNIHRKVSCGEQGMSNVEVQAIRLIIDYCGFEILHYVQNDNYFK